MAAETREEFLNWLNKQEKAVDLYLDQGLSMEAGELAQEALIRLGKTEGLASQEGLADLWKEKQVFFKSILDKSESVRKKYEDDDTLPDLGGASQGEMSPHGLFARGEALFDVGEHEKAMVDLLTAFEQGLKQYDVAFLVLECQNKLGKLEDQIGFIQRTLSEAELNDGEKSKLFYRLGLIYLHFNRKSQARQALWQVKRLDPEFPGLMEKLKPLESEKGRAKTKYDLLMEEAKISHDDLEKALRAAKERKTDPDQLLMAEYKVSKEDLGVSLSNYYNVPFVAFDPAMEPPFEVFEKKKLDPDFLKKNRWTPFGMNGKAIEILMANPFDLDKVGEIKFLYETNNVQVKVALADDINQFIENFYRKLSSDKELSSLGEELDVDASFDDLAVTSGSEDEASLTEGDSEVVRLVNALLVEAWRKNVSDIHIEPNPRNRYCMIRFRSDGSCYEYRKIKFGLAKPLVSRVKIMASLDIAERRLPQDGKIKIKLPDRNQVVEYRVAVLPTVDGQEDVVLRVLASGKPLPLEKLGLLERNLELFKKCVYKPYGLILVVGPTGSGKTTTLHSGVSYINLPDRKIWTAEDPVEITQDGLRQLQVNAKIGLTFAAAMRSFLRADPDVILIGEMRDEETAHIGIEASLTGHLVFSTLHTNSAPETITRLLDMNVDPFNFADSLICVLAQRLMKTLCSKCKEAYKPAKKELEEFGQEFGENFVERTKEFGLDLKTIELFKPKGCSACVGGYRGRVGVHELMVNTPPMKTMIKFKKPTEVIRDEAIKNGMLTLKQDAMMKVLMGMADMKQVRAVAG